MCIACVQHVSRIGVPSDAMSIETPEELEAMRRVGALVRRTIAVLREAVAPGVTTGELDALAARELAREGATSAPMDLVAIFFRNIAQVYLLGSAVSGVIILAGILIASVPAGIAAAAGSLISMIVAMAMGTDPKAVSQGLYGFSPVLTAMAVGVIFLTPSPRVALYAGLATCACSREPIVPSRLALEILRLQSR